MSMSARICSTHSRVNAPRQATMPVVVNWSTIWSMSNDRSDVLSDVCELMAERSRRRRTELLQPVGICGHHNLRSPDQAEAPSGSRRHQDVVVWPGATRYTSGEVANALGGQVIGSTATPARCPTRPGQSEVHTCTHGVSGPKTMRTPSPY